MLSPQLRRKVHDLWSLFWSSGLSNPLVAIEQITFLLFVRQLEALDRERVAYGKPSIYEPMGSSCPCGNQRPPN
jgi:type I restriction enzyme M protein